MHELSIAQSIFKIVTEELEKRENAEIKAIGLRIGALSGILPDALEFSFDAIKQDTSLATTYLKMEIIPLKGKCKSCNTEFKVEDLVFACPTCHSGQIEVEQGQELEIAYLELNE